MFFLIVRLLFLFSIWVIFFCVSVKLFLYFLFIDFLFFYLLFSCFDFFPFYELLKVLSYGLLHGEGSLTHDLNDVGQGQCFSLQQAFCKQLDLLLVCKQDFTAGMILGINDAWDFAVNFLVCEVWVVLLVALLGWVIQSSELRRHTVLSDHCSCDLCTFFKVITGTSRNSPKENLLSDTPTQRHRNHVFKLLSCVECQLIR